jgi:hypothetical protein
VIFSLYPPFNFSRAFGNIARLASSYPDFETLNWVEGTGFGWKNFNTPIGGYLEFLEY